MHIAKLQIIIKSSEDYFSFVSLKTYHLTQYLPKIYELFNAQLK